MGAAVPMKPARLSSAGFVVQARTNARPPNQAFKAAAVPTGPFPAMARASSCEPQRLTERTSMKSMRSLAFGLLAVVALAVFSVSSAWRRTVDAVSSGVCRLKAWALDGIDLFAQPASTDSEAVPLVQRVRQAADSLRLFKREKPIVTPRWRMCQST